VSLQAENRPVLVTSNVRPIERAPAALRGLHPAADHTHRITAAPIGGDLKRAVDVIGATLALIALSPLLITAAAAVAIESPGPVLFRQLRGGFRGEVFRICKFRTMRVTEDGRNLTQASERDPRVTLVGAFLRRTSLDELPQLLNVISGEMSLVGPRPHAVSHDNAFARIDEKYRKRQMAKPGITGLAQVNGARGPTETHEHVRERLMYDLQYVDNWSLWLDIKIALKTIVVVLRGKNAF
jgi:putative colanic acid biosysnthesis UDP-glucose lipid carrier transferase